MSRESQLDDDGFVVSLFAALEARSLSAGAAMALPYLGMARSELSPIGTQAARFRAVRFADFAMALEELDRRLTGLMSSHAQLEDTLRVRRAQEILREGMAQP